MARNDAPEPPKKMVKREIEADVAAKVKAEKGAKAEGRDPAAKPNDAAVLESVEDDGDENTLIIKFKPGQRKPTPPGGEGTRVFYETLYKQNPQSYIALSWCLAHGVLPLKDVPDALVKLEKLKEEHLAALANRPKGK